MNPPTSSKPPQEISSKHVGIVLDKYLHCEEKKKQIISNDAKLRWNNALLKRDAMDPPYNTINNTHRTPSIRPMVVVVSMYI